MTIADALASYALKLDDALEQHTRNIADVRSIAKDAQSLSRVTQLAASSLGTQIDEAEKRVMRSVDRLERKLDALLRAAILNPEDFRDG